MNAWKATVITTEVCPAYGEINEYTGGIEEC